MHRRGRNPSALQVLHACKMTMGPSLWPDEAAIGDDEESAMRPSGVDRCAYECVLAIAGAASYKNYFKRTTALRVAPPSCLTPPTLPSPATSTCATTWTLRCCVSPTRPAARSTS